MSGIKRTQADIAFSKCIRFRAHYSCERCGTQYNEKSTSLECSHFHGRASWSVRFHPDNCASLCTGCHMYLTANPAEHRRWFEDLIGSVRYEILLELKRDTRIGKVYRATGGKGDIARHYRDELKRMEQARAAGDREVDFEAWQ